QDFFQTYSTEQDFVPLCRVEVCRFYLCGAEVGVVVDGESVGRLIASHVFEEAGGPSDVAVGGMSAWAGCYQERLGVHGKLRDPFAIERRVLLWTHGATASPGLVAYSPIANVEWLFVAVGGAFVGQTQCSSRRIAVGNPIVKFLRSARAYVCGYIWF